MLAKRHFATGQTVDFANIRVFHKDITLVIMPVLALETLLTDFDTHTSSSLNLKAGMQVCDFATWKQKIPVTKCYASED